MKRIFLFLLLVPAIKTNAQQYSLYNTRTLFDAFENPARKVYTQDTSRKFSFNFFIPVSSTNAIATGNAQTSIRRVLTTGVYTGRGLTLGKGELNYLTFNQNTYLFMFRMYNSVLNHSEMGFSWQVRSDNFGKITNETIAVFDTPKLFDGTSYPNPFNDLASSQSYHQFAFSYRKNIDRWLGVGAKISFLSGIAYNKLHVKSSSFTNNTDQNTIDLAVNGSLQSSYSLNNLRDDLAFMPGFTNPGLAISAGATYKMKYGWNISGQLKDIGFIRWNKKSFVYNINTSFSLNNSPGAANDFTFKLDSTTQSNSKNKSLISPLKGKAEFFINKDYAHYRPGLLISKNTFDLHGDIGILNNFNFGVFNFGFSTVYNTTNALQFGGMGLIKTDHFEIFLGTDQVFKTYRLVRGLIASDSEIGKGYTGASVYFGLAFNFGRIMEHPMNTNRIPGINR